MQKQRVFGFNALTVAKLENMRGGKGPMDSRMSVSPAKPIEGSVFVAAGLNTLMPGSSVGYHEHINDEEIYVIHSGTGHYIDNEEKRHPVCAGDLTICVCGEKHGLENTGAEPLTFVAVIAKK